MNWKYPRFIWTVWLDEAATCNWLSPFFCGIVANQFLQTGMRIAIRLRNHERWATATTDGQSEMIAVLQVALALLTAGRSEASQYTIKDKNGYSVAYDVLRSMLLKDKWNPDGKHDADGCSSFSEWCASRPEMVACWTTTETPGCLWRWSRQNDVLTITTRVDGDEVESVERSTRAESDVTLHRCF